MEMGQRRHNGVLGALARPGKALGLGTLRHCGLSEISSTMQGTKLASRLLCKQRFLCSTLSQF